MTEHQVNECVETHAGKTLQMEIILKANTVIYSRMAGFSQNDVTMVWLFCCSSTAPWSSGGGGSWCMREWRLTDSTGECGVLNLVKGSPLCVKHFKGLLNASDILPCLQNLRGVATCFPEVMCLSQS